jgi:hypothetical protein
MYQTYIVALRDKDFLELFMILVSSSQYSVGTRKTRSHPKTRLRVMSTQAM